MFEILPHTADVRVRLDAADERSLFADGAAAFRAVAAPAVDADCGETITVTIEADDLTALLVDFLNQLVWLLAVRRLAPRDVEVVELSGERLVAAVSLEPVARWSRDVKAVTYHDAEVRHVDGTWTATLVLDI